MDTNEIKQKISNGESVVIDFFATWCGPCKAMAPRLHAIEKEYEGRVSFYEVNVEEETDFSNEYKIRSLPTLVYIKGGEEKDRTVGAITDEAIKEKINGIL